MRRAITILMMCAFALGAVRVTGGNVTMTHEIQLKKGWNALFFPVSPIENADVLFAQWPVGSVGYYDQAAFLRTEQFDAKADDMSAAVVENGMKLWVRGNPALSTFTHARANGIYLCYATNSFSTTICGVPEAMRASIHSTHGNTRPVNYIGISTDGGAADLTTSGYFDGLDCQWSDVNYVYGSDAQEPKLGVFPKKPTAGNGAVVAINAVKSVNWFGAFKVVPATGISLGTNGCSAVLSVRNETKSVRRARVSFHEANGPHAAFLPAVKYRDGASSDGWRQNLAEQPFEVELPAGAEVRLVLAVDRRELSGSAGDVLGGIIRVTDVTSGNSSRFQTAVPFAVEHDGGAFANTLWPKGLWLAELALNALPQIIPGGKTNWIEKTETDWDYDPVTGEQYDSGRRITNVVAVVEKMSAEMPAGSEMKVRVMIHVAADGSMKLVQRARIGGRRYSCVCLPSDQPLIGEAGHGTFGQKAVFEFTVAEKSRINPSLHPLHPDHDGLQTDFKTPAPSGDEAGNYLFASPKPELFSIANKIEFVWSDGIAAPWSPDETLYGSCVWNFSGLRHEGGIPVSGKFTMKRIDTGDLDTINELW